MSYYIHNLQFPFTETVLNFKELNCEQSSSLIKINTNFPASSQDRLDYHIQLVNILKDSIKEKENIYNLNILEFLMFCIRLRALSVSSTVELEVQKKEDKNVKVIVNFYDLMANVFDAAKIIENYKNLEYENIEVSIGWPLLKDEVYFLTNIEEDNFKKFINSIPLFIESLKIKDKTFNFKDFNFEQRRILIDSIPVSIQNILQTNILSLLKELSESTLFGLDYFDQYKLEFYNGTIQDLIRFLFAGTEDSEMAEICFLKKFNFTMDEIYKMTPQQKNNYIKYLVQSTTNQPS
jgi:hypothetical protein